MQAAKTLTTTQRTRRRPIHFLITTITFGMNAMVEGRPRQLKMPRLDAYGTGGQTAGPKGLRRPP
jgi:FKBP-type peptidyl-prolyl cis-trans isomerase